MDLQETASVSCEGVPVIMNYVDDSPLREADESYNTVIQDETLDIKEMSLDAFKKELENFDVDIKEKPCLEDTNHAPECLETLMSNIIEKNTLGVFEKSLNITSNKTPDARKLIINEQEKTLIPVENPALIKTINQNVQRARKTANNAPHPKKEHLNKTEFNSMIASPDESSFVDHTLSLMVTNYKESSLTCSKCSSVVDRNNFKQHIDSCFPRNTLLEKVNSDEAHGYEITSSNQTVNNPCMTEAASSDLSIPLNGEQLQKNNDEKNLLNAKLSSKVKRVGSRRSCNLCSYVSAGRISLKVHKMGHEKNKPIIQCDKCTFRSTRRALEAHQKKIHAYVTDLHAGSNKMVMALNNIENRKEDNTSFCCSTCSFTTDKQQILKNHERQHRRTNLPIVQCFYCSHRYTRYMLYLHIQKTHPGQRFQFVCKRSDKIHTKSSLESSIGSLSTSEEDSEEEHVSENTDKSPHFEATQNCSLCPFSTSDQVTLGVHLRKHEFEPIERTTKLGRIKYDCRLCSHGDQTLSRIIGHINLHIQNVPITKCPECDFRSTDLALVSHMRKCIISESASQNSLESDKVSSKKCISCSFSTHNYLKLQLHIKEKHFIKGKDFLGRLFYQCELCSFINRAFPAMMAHMKSHKKNVPIVKCPYCEFKSISITLKCHLKRCKSKTKVHIGKNDLSEPIGNTDSSGPVSIRCNMCSYNSYLLTDVLRHIKTHKKNLPILSCSFCDFKSTERAMRYHRNKCKSADVELSRDVLEKAAEKNYFEKNEITIKSGKMDSDLRKSIKTNLYTLDVEDTKLVLHETITDQNLIQSFRV